MDINESICAITFVWDFSYILYASDCHGNIEAIMIICNIICTPFLGVKSVLNQKVNIES